MRFAANSFTWVPDLRAVTRTPLEVLTGVVDAGVTDLLEIEAGQCLRSFPDPDPAEVAALRDGLAERGAAVGIVGIDLDDWLSPTRRRDDAARLAFLEPQLRAAAALGAAGVRLPIAQAGPVLPARLLALLHELDLVLYQEIQGPQSPAAPPLAAAIADVADRGDPHLRLLLDTSVLMPAVPVTYLERLRRSGVPAELVDRVEGEWADPATAAAARACLADGLVPPSVIPLFMALVVRFGRSGVTDLNDVLPLVGAVHAKVWDLDDADGRVTAPLHDLAAVLPAGVGTVCSEWGGHDWLAGVEDATDVTRRHLALLGEVFAPPAAAPSSCGDARGPAAEPGIVRTDRAGGSELRADALAAAGDGFVLRVGSPWMRSLPVSCVLDLEVEVDGTPVEQRVDAEPDAWWFPQDRLVVRGAHPVVAGVSYAVEVRLRLLLPYLSAGPGAPAILPFRLAATVVAGAADGTPPVARDVPGPGAVDAHR